MTRRIGIWRSVLKRFEWSATDATGMFKIVVAGLLNAQERNRRSTILLTCRGEIPVPDAIERRQNSEYTPQKISAKHSSIGSWGNRGANMSSPPPVSSGPSAKRLEASGKRKSCLRRNSRQRRDSTAATSACWNVAYRARRSKRSGRLRMYLMCGRLK